MVGRPKGSKNKRKGRVKALPSPFDDKMIRNAPVLKVKARGRVCSRCGYETASMVCSKCGGITRIEG